MIYIIKIAIILLIELNIYFMLGIGMSKMKIFPNTHNFVGRFIIGFLGYHALFWMVTFPCVVLDKSLTLVVWIWLCMVVTMIFMIIVRIKDEVFDTYCLFIKKIFEYKWYVASCLMIVLFLMYFVSVNGQVDIDARTYIGQVTTMLASDRLVGIRPATGMATTSIHLKEAWATFGVNSAVLCKIFVIHPLIFCRTVRAMVNIIILTAASYEVLKWVYKDSNEPRKNAIMTVMLSEAILFLMENSIYTSSAFILRRAYEGKAYCAGALVLVTLHLVISLHVKQDNKYFVLIFVAMIASASISASAVFVLPIIIAPMIFVEAVIEKNYNRILYLALALLPNVVYILITISGFSVIALEG